MKSVKVKTVKPKGELMEMAQSFNSIFAPSESNRHIYMYKILKQFKEHNALLDVIIQMDKSLFGSKYLKDLRKTHSEEDLKNLEKIKSLWQEAEKIVNMQNLNATEIQINVSKFSETSTNFKNLEELNSYLQGITPFTLPQLLTTQVADIYRVFKDIDTCNTQQIKAIISSKLGDEPLKLLNLPLHSYLQDLVLDDSKGENEYQIVKLCLMMLFKAQKKRYASINIPEFEVSNIKEMVKQAISEFKKQLRGCDEAFKQLLKSLDTFTDNFDDYYEQFQLNGKEPSVLFVNFIDDVSKQYSNTDTQKSRVILSQFKRIQKEFGKKLGTQINNPQIQQLYKQLEKQISKAQTLIGMEDENEEDHPQTLDNEEPETQEP